MAKVIGNYPERVLVTDGTNSLLINSNGTLPISGANDAPVDIQIHGEVDQNNSTTAPLLANTTFTGTATDTLHNAIIFVNIYSDVASATDGLVIQQSADGNNWYWEDYYTIPADTGKTFSFQAALRYLRIKYTNGGSNQTTFTLNVMLKSGNAKPSSHRVQDPIVDDDDAELTKTVISAKTNGTYHNIEATPEGKLQVSVVTPVGLLPVSQLTTLFDGKLLNRAMPEIIEVVGTGTNTYSVNKYDLAVAAGQWSIIQSKRFMPYFSGKPQKVELTFDNFAPEADVVKRVGYFSSSTVSPYSATLDGIWLESGGGTITLKASRAGTETISVDITDWVNYNRLGAYQNLANWDNFTVIEFNFLWLGGAYLELRLVVPELGFVTAHGYVYGGTAQDVFIQSPNQPVRYEIRSTTGTGNFRYICNQVASSGSIDESWLGKSVDTGTSPVTFSSTGTTYPVIAIRKGTTYRANPVAIKSIDLLITTNDRLRWSLQVNPTLSAALTYTPATNSAIEKANGNGVITVTSSGLVIASGYLGQGEQINPALFEGNFLSELGGSITGTQDQYVFSITPISSTLDVLASLNYFEG